MDPSIDKDYYKPTKTVSNFDNNNNYIEYESKEDKDKTLSITEYLSMIRPYLSDITDDHKTQGEWKIQLSIRYNFMSSKDFDEARTMHTISDYIEIMTGNKTRRIIKKLYNTLLQK